MLFDGPPWWHTGKESTCRSTRRDEFDPWVGKIPWRRKRQTPPVFLPMKSYGQGSLAGCSLWGCKRVRRDLVTKRQPPLALQNTLGSIKHSWKSNSCSSTLLLGMKKLKPRKLKWNFHFQPLNNSKSCRLETPRMLAICKYPFKHIEWTHKGINSSIWKWV